MKVQDNKNEIKLTAYIVCCGIENNKEEKNEETERL